MFEKWKQARRERNLRQAERRLKDAIYNLEHWSFADRPSRREDRLEDIYWLIRRVEILGGDALALMPYRWEYLVAEAMPEIFKRVRTGYTSSPYWETVRIEDCPAISPDGERCKYQAGHDKTGEPHSWTMFGFGGPGA